VSDEPPRKRGRPPKPKPEGPPPPKRPRGRPRKEGRVTDSTGFADLSEADFTRALLRDALADLDRARADGGGTAIGQLTNHVRQLRRDLAVLEEAERPGASGGRRSTSTDAELRSMLVTAIARVDDATFELVCDAVDARRSGRPTLRVLTPDGSRG
jgi:hypothetical protein